MKKIIIIIFLLAFFFFSCKSNYRIEEKDFVNLYADLLILKEMYRGNDSGYIKARDSVYNVYNVNKSMVEKTLEYYNSDSEKWKKFFEKVVKRLEEQPTSIKLNN
ncbi:MAG: DUF4296 domain-containing protein [Ignavibacteria bacterium]